LLCSSVHGSTSRNRKEKEPERSTSDGSVLGSVNEKTPPNRKGYHARLDEICSCSFILNSDGRSLSVRKFPFRLRWP
jgi:hypothetical protein